MSNAAALPTLPAPTTVIILKCRVEGKYNLGVAAGSPDDYYGARCSVNDFFADAAQA